jgi:hypothetical protein
MKKIVFTVLVSLAVFFSLSNCGGGANVEQSAEMKEFVGMIKGKSADVVSALSKFASTPELKSNDMGMYDLSDPKITAKNGDCYSVEFSAGATTRMYDICWAAGKISSIADKGMK